MVHVIRLSHSSQSISIFFYSFLSFHPCQNSPISVSSISNPLPVPRSCHTPIATACRVSSFLPSMVCMLPVNSYLGYMHGVCWRVYGRYITELDIHVNHTCMAYAGRDCGIHWLGRVYLTGLGENSDKLDSLDVMDGDLFYLYRIVSIICD